MQVGDRLRQGRVRLGIDLDQLARDTRISRRYLEAIEADNPAGCPGAFFYRSFVRQYAAAVGLDPAELEREVDRLQPSIVSMPDPHALSEFPLKTPDPLLSASNRMQLAGGTRLWVSVIALVAVIAGCTALYAWLRREPKVAMATPDASKSTVQPSQPAVVPTATGTTAGPPPSTSTQVPAPGGQPAEAAPAASQTASSNAPSGQAPAGAQPVSPEDRVQLVLSSREPAWISLHADGKTVFVGTLKPGQTKTVAGKERARMRIGNAGGVDVMFNGKAIGSVGPRGQIRVVVFTPEGYHVLSASELEEAP